ncbi:MAG: AzlD domain-containing protein [Chloroflexi bacterium]|jgi:branched-subunit amino acid transport protein|nr:AzlD domain-containing protein [Chloroflexota bacterium]
MSLDLVVLALLMGAVTYPSRAIPLLAPGLERLPAVVLAYLRLVGPAVLASLAAVNALVVVAPDGSPVLHVGIEAAAVAVAVAIVAWRRTLLLPAIVVAVVVVAGARALGLA